eukprot:CAMPEP_0184362852 /NCGR_PEP_ID=MMETSP1089-20130417/136862_1 /TAXON_ID=38269 ORGANISM="Gloeochaete wittrockiana, Strain SAG46.84" /NCGR_SAMPLE_ID=MMETSP1089 /ASSEMBLY_ACC=CAM_ASM_000445 /LENGTH=218 /DNA_ID=CAMNT_0026703111 /DNA_START=145 /DNA_END=799 /DNA_ORIENTATION=-
MPLAPRAGSLSNMQNSLLQATGDVFQEYQLLEAIIAYHEAESGAHPHGAGLPPEVTSQASSTDTPPPVNVEELTEGAIIRDPATIELLLPTLKSGHGDRAQMVFMNSGAESIDVLWIAFDGSEKKYHTLRAGGGYSQSTYLTHPWIVRETKSRRPLCLAAPTRTHPMLVNVLEFCDGAIIRSPTSIELLLQTLKSRKSGPPTKVVFRNSGAVTVDVLW